MKLGLQVPDFTWEGGPSHIADHLRSIALRAEEAGMASIWFMDHFFQISMVGPAEHEMLEGWTTLGFVAGITSRITLGTMVTGVTYRNPAHLVKIATTLDVLSQGRAYLGIGAAWNEEEHRGYGFSFPPLGERFERLEETLQIAHQMWTDNDAPFHGTHYSLERPLNHPQPLHTPHPPILIGGSGEQKTLRLVALYADACNLFGHAGASVVAHKLDVLREHCERVERNYDEIEKTVLLPVTLTRDGRNGSMTPEGFLELLSPFHELGVTHVITSFRNVTSEEPFALVRDDIMPELNRHFSSTAEHHS